MSTFKCKMCGGTLEIQPGQTVAECEYCGTQQTVAKSRDEVISNLFSRANALRMKSEFDRAEQTYEKILEQDNTEAEAHWGIVLCRYGIEYVEDPKTFKRIPTCHRTSYKAVTADADYLAALEYADLSQKAIYQAEAKAIDEIQKNILAIVKNEKPFDVFICYKESDESGRRTHDSVIANDIYHQLTQEGFKVFYAAITLEDKLGQAYEPYIFAALNSAKVMLVLGTKPEYFNAVWVKNEWSRFLQLMRNDRSKLLIPCYRDMDAYDLPEEFAHLQAQDMSKIGFINDVVRGIKKVVRTETATPTVAKEVIKETAGNTNTAPLLKRAFLFLEDGDWASADEYCEKVLDIDPENGEAYLVKTLAQEKCRTIDIFVNKRKDAASAAQGETLQLEPNESHIAEMVKKFAIPAHGYLSADTIRNMYKYDLSYHSATADRKMQYRSEEIYWSNHKLLSRAEKYAEGTVAEKLANAKKALFATLSERQQQTEVAEKAEKEALLKRYSGFLAQTDAAVEERYRKVVAQREEDYESWLSRANEETNPTVLKNLADCFAELADYKASAEISKRCLVRAEEEQTKIVAEKERLTEISHKEAERIAKRNKKIAIICTAVAAVALAVFLVVTQVVVPNAKYNNAVGLMEAGQYEEAMSAFEAMDEYKDSTDKFLECKYLAAIEQMEIGNVVEAYEALIALDGYKDSADKAKSIYIKYRTEELKTAKVGDYVVFGTYEQDNDTSNGEEDIEWLVLAIKDGKALVTSKYALDCKQYNTKWSSVTWETCPLRQWLNKNFLNVAFSTEEQAVISTITVSANKNPSYSTAPGKATQDKVFLLSIQEANKYFASDGTRQCKPTDYAVANGVYVNSVNGNCWWWLRSPGYAQDTAAIVDFTGDIEEVGLGVDDCRVAVRPAMWIDLDV